MKTTRSKKQDRHIRREEEGEKELHEKDVNIDPNRKPASTE